MYCRRQGTEPGATTISASSGVEWGDCNPSCMVGCEDSCIHVYEGLTRVSGVEQSILVTMIMNTTLLVSVHSRPGAQGSTG